MFPTSHDAMDALEIPNEGEDGGVVWISSNSNSDSDDNDGDNDPLLEPFVESLQALMEYGPEDVDDAKGELMMLKGSFLEELFVFCVL
ncbi:unnamed protein product [Linum trigynum]|uniref:Uncharacterized protein n=1 Tax=Linum trigynum TaxID=586398 RepID=A0AAV2E6B0_9ROSI